MRLTGLSFSLLMLGRVCSGQSVIPLTDGGPGTRLNQQAVDQSRASKDKQAVVRPGDHVIPQFVDGGGWKTTGILMNLETHATVVEIVFFRDDGSDLNVPVIGQGTVRGLTVGLSPGGSFTFETAGTADVLSQGWALMHQGNNDAVGGMAIFRQRVDGRPDQEAAVPAISQYDNHFVMPFDNNNFTTSVAAANPTGSSMVGTVNIRDESGLVIDQRSIGLPPYGHTALSTTGSWPSTREKRGTLEFIGVGALGLRFTGSAFTSLPALENPAWVVAPPQ